MNVRAKPLAIIAILVFAILAASQAQALSGQSAHSAALGVNFNCMGASGSPASQVAVFSDLDKAHAGWVRIFLPWNAIEPPDSPEHSKRPKRPDPFDPTNLGYFRSCIDQATAQGFRVLVVFLSNPAWVSKHWNDPPRQKAYVSALSYLAGHFKSVSAWEVWNEENKDKFWNGNAVQYVRLLQASYRAVKTVNPKVLVVIGGTEHNDADWLQKCYDAGARGYFDVMATHPYPRHNMRQWSQNIEQTFGPAEQVHQVMVDNGDAGKPIWFTEFGWSRSKYIKPHRQAQLLYRSYAYIVSRLPYVQTSFWYEAQTEDLPQKQHIKQWRWLSRISLITRSNGVTPAYRAMVAVGTDLLSGDLASGKASGGYAKRPPGHSG